MMRYGGLIVGSWERTDGSVGPPGVVWPETERAWNFSLYSRYATGVTSLRGASDLYVMINAWWHPIRFHIQEGEAEEWKRVVDTSRASPDDIAEPDHERALESLGYAVAPRSVVVLEST